MKFSKTEGRHIVAKQKIIPGDVLIVDTPYIASLFPEHQDTHCHHCFKRLGDDCVPSPICDNVSSIHMYMEWMEDNHSNSFRLNFAVSNVLVSHTMRPINMKEACYTSLIVLTLAGWRPWLTGEYHL